MVAVGFDTLIDDSLADITNVAQLNASVCTEPEAYPRLCPTSLAAAPICVFHALVETICVPETLHPAAIER